MIYESYPWKQDLLRRKRLFLKYNTEKHFEKDEEATYTVLEKAVFYSAFIIRKLLDCKEKLSDDADNYRIPVEKRNPTRMIDRMHRWPDEREFQWDSVNREIVNGNNVCNWLIHSFVFVFDCQENGVVEGFFVSSDKDRNKALYYIGIDEWLKYMDFIASDDIVELSMQYDETKKDYVITKKVRG